MDILKHLKKLEDKIESLFDPAKKEPSSEDAPGPEAAAPRLREPLELKKAILSRIEEEVRRIDGKPAFPFNRIDVELWAPDARAKALLEAELADNDRLEQDILRTLQAARVEPDRRLLVRLHFLEGQGEAELELRARGFRIECSREQETERIRGGVPRAKLTVEQGEAEVSELALQKSRTNLGRLGEVVDEHGRVVRRNELAFKDAVGVNATVSRVHAHIRFEQDSGEFRLFDDNSAEGTLIFRDGRRIPVPSQRRGVVLQDGDEVYLGQARLRFERR